MFHVTSEEVALHTAYVSVHDASVSALCRDTLHPQTEEIGLQIITTAKISNKFSRESPYISIPFSRESPKFQTGFHGSRVKSPSLKRWTGKPSNLEIQIFWVWSPPWVICMCLCIMQRYMHSAQTLLWHSVLCRDTLHDACLCVMQRHHAETYARCTDTPVTLCIMHMSLHNAATLLWHSRDMSHMWSGHE